MTVKSFSPYLIVRGAEAALAFYTSAFGAKENYRLIDPADGRIGHAEFELGGTIFMIADEYPDFGAVGPDTIGGSPVKMQIYVADADAVFARALGLGTTEVRPVKD
jgi:PhnB protein